MSPEEWLLGPSAPFGGLVPRRRRRQLCDDHAVDLPHPVTGQPFPSPVPPGTGWPDDPATPATPVARDAADVRRIAVDADPPAPSGAVSVCRACDRLVAWRESVARVKRASYATEPYWGRP